MSSSPLAADIEISDTSNSKFTGENRGDLILYTESPQQSILFGTVLGSSPAIRLSHSDVAVSKSIVPRANGLCDLGTPSTAFSNVYTFNVDVQDTVKTAGTVRLDALGILSNVSIPASASSVNIDATRLTSGVVSNARLTTASTAMPGIVQLSDAINSAVSDRASTPLAVKTAYDLANAALPRAGGTLTGPLNGTVINACNVLQTGGVARLDATGVLSNVTIPSTATSVNIDGTRITSGIIPNSRFTLASVSGPGIVQLSDSVNSSSSSNAATSAAVQSAYDLANAALPKTGGTLTGPLSVPNLNVDSTISISGVQRIDAAGVLSSVSVPSTATTVNIDASRITSGIVDNAHLTFGTTNARGIVQLSDSVSTQNSGTAATSTAVKSAYDLASNALPRSGGNLTGPLAVPDLDVANSFSTNGIVRIDGNGMLDNVTIAETSMVEIDASRLTSGIVDNGRLVGASTTVPGIVRLCDECNLSDSSLAATSTAVKAVYDYVTSVTSNLSAQSTETVQSNGIIRIDKDGILSNVSAPAGATTVNIDATRITSGTLGNARLTLASTGTAGIVQLSDAVNSTSSSTASTSAALKTTYDLASNALPRSGGTITGALTLNSNLFVGNHVIPTSNVVYDLGSSNMRFRDLYLSGNSINLGGATIKAQSNNSVSLGGVNIKVLSEMNSYNSAILASGVSNWATVPAAPDNTAWRGMCWSGELSMFVAVTNAAVLSNVMTSPNGVNWTTRVTSTSNNSWDSVCWAPELSLFAAVGFSGTGNRVMTSPDGITWTSRTSAADNSWNSICWSPDLTLFAAVSSTGAGNRVMTSPDGITWTSRTSAADVQWTSVCWSSELGLFAAVANTGTGNRVMTSPNGINWTSRTSAADNSWTSVTWSSKLGLFAAVSTNGTGNRVMTSPDGVSWTSRTSAADLSWADVCWSPQMSMFVAVSSSGAGNRIMTSFNGVTWTSRTSPADNGWLSVCWAPELGIFAATANSGTNRVMITSPVVSGAKNTLIANPAYVSMSSSNTLAVPNVSVSGHIVPASNVAYDLGSSNFRFRDLYLSGNTIDLAGAKISSLNSNVIIGGINPKALYPIEDYNAVKSMTWSLTPSANDTLSYSTGSGVCWSPELSIFVALNTSATTSGAMTSPNGINWTARSTPTNQWNSVCWSPQLMLFAAVASTGTGNRVMTSPDGVTWTSRTSAADNAWASVCWSPELALFAAVGNTGTGNRVMTSPDGITWTSRTSAADHTWVSVCWSSELNLFAAVATNIVSTQVMTSSDGVSWALRTSAASNQWTSICWSAKLMMFAAVANNGAGNRVMTSSDGLTWTARTSAADNGWSSICWSPQLSLFTAVAATGLGSLVMSSTDGIQWKPYASAAANNWRSVAWSPDLSIFVATSSSGTNRVMVTSPVLPAPRSTLIANPAFLSLTSNNTLAVNNLNVASNVQTSGVVRIDSSGALSNVTISSNSSTVSIDASRLTSGTLSNVVIPNLDAAKITTGTFTTNQIPSLDAAKITTGTFTTNQIPSLDAAKITTGTFTTNQIPSLDAAKITTGTFTTNQIPSLDAAKITTGTLSNARLPLATTTSAGIVQLSDSVTSSSSSNAATPAAVKTTYDLANNALPRTGGNMTGPLGTPSGVFLFGTNDKGWGVYAASPSAGASLNSTTPPAGNGFSGPATRIRCGGASDQGFILENYNDQLLISTNGSTGNTWIRGGLTIGGQLNVSNSIVPTSNLAYDLGTSNARFRDLYLSGNTIDLGGVTIKGTADADIEVAGVKIKSITQRTRPTLNNWSIQRCSDGIWRSVCWSPERGIFVACGNGSSSGAERSYVMTSTDGVTWADRTTSVNNWGSVCWSSELGLFVAVGNSIMITSLDGITWTNRGAPNAVWQFVCWSPQRGIFVATSNSLFATSPDGITWTSRTAPNTATWAGVCWSPELSLFIVVGSTASSNSIATSPDGITWTARSAPVSGVVWYNVCWSPQASILVAIATSSSSTNIMTSPNGINWTLRTAPNALSRLGICWSPERNVFVICCGSSPGNSVLTSPDGITWTARSTPLVDNTWSSICWSSELDMFVAVSNTGTLNRVMTNHISLTGLPTASYSLPGIVRSTPPYHALWVIGVVGQNPNFSIFDPLYLANTSNISGSLQGRWSGWTAAEASSYISTGSRGFSVPVSGMWMISAAVHHDYTSDGVHVFVHEQNASANNTSNYIGQQVAHPRLWNAVSIPCILSAGKTYGLSFYNGVNATYLSYNRMFGMTLMYEV